MNDDAKTIAEASNVFFSIDLSTIFGILTVRAFSAGMRVAERRRLLRARRFLAQAVLRYPTLERQKGNAQPQSGGFDLTSYFTMNKTLELSRSPPSRNMTCRFARTSFSS
jgi:hypothetical protein